MYVFYLKNTTNTMKSSFMQVYCGLLFPLPLKEKTK